MHTLRTRRLTSAFAALALAVGMTALSAPAHAASKKPGAFKVSATYSGTSTATIKWTASKKASYYRVCLRSSGTAKSCTHLSGKRTGTRSFAFTQLKPTGGTDWFASVTAYNAKGNRTTAKRGFDLKVGAAPRPTGTTTTNQVSVSWGAVTNAHTYQVQIAKNSAFTSGASTRTTSSRTAAFTALAPDTTYYTRVRGRDDLGKVGPWSTATQHRTNPTNEPTGPGQLPGPRHTGGLGDHLTFDWPAIAGAQSYEVQISPDRTFGSKVGGVTTTQPQVRLNGLNGGSIYYTRFRAVTTGKAGAWSAATTVRLAQPAVDVTVVSYNLCGQNKCRDGAAATFLANVPLWTVRKPIAGALVRSADPDIVLTQESKDTETKFHTELSGYTSGPYKSGKASYFRTSRFTSVDNGWITLDSPGKKYATWEKLREKATGSTFYVVNAHLTPGKGKAKDDQRTKEMGILISSVAKVNVYGLPVVWGGDWNSNADNANQSKYPGGHNAPTVAFAAQGIADTVTMVNPANAVNAKLNSSNYGAAAPKASGHHIDGIFVGTNSQVSSWRMLANFTDGSTVWEKDKTYTTPFGSDHNPIVATLLLGVS